NSFQSIFRPFDEPLSTSGSINFGQQGSGFGFIVPDGDGSEQPYLHINTRSALETRILEQDVPTHFETHSGFAFDTMPSFRAIWLPPGAIAGSAGRGDWWRVG